jgi:hypothetical protein
MKAEAGIELAILSLQQNLISAKENNCPLKPVTTGKHCLRWTPELKSLRTGAESSGDSVWRFSGDTERR